MGHQLGKRLIDLKRLIVANFNSGHWQEVALLTGQEDAILRHPRLLRSLGFGDEDYEGNVLVVLRQIAASDEPAIRTIEEYVVEHFDDSSTYISAKESTRRITFAPSVFDIPEHDPEPDLASVMMPIRAEFDDAFHAIQQACQDAGFRCLRADNVWEHSVIVQDIFDLIFRSKVVVVDFSSRNANVTYETGIAHALGKDVIPIAQSLDDVPFDLKHHRVLTYLNNQEGLRRLKLQLSQRLRQFAPPTIPTPASPDGNDDEDVPF